MKKVFLYLYPIKEYQRLLMCSDNYYINHDIEKLELKTIRRNFQKY